MWFSARIPLAVGVAVLVGCADEGPSNTPPTAAFTVACDDLTCTLINSSNDTDGNIESHAWDFGDGGTSKEQHPTHTYAAPGGQFTVGLTVTDDRGGAATAAGQVNVSPGNTAPVAAFAVFCTNVTCSFTDQSTDSDGTIRTHAWDFGDGGMSTGPHASHTYPATGGRFIVGVTVTDDEGARATAAKQLDVAPASMPDRSGIYERETAHGTPGRHSRFVIRNDGTFELQDGIGALATVYTGRWGHEPTWGPLAVEPGSFISLDFAAFGANSCGEGFGAFFLDTHLAISYCGAAIQAGLEEGFYTSAPGPDIPGLPPPLAGQLLFVRDGRVHRVNTDGGGPVQLSAGPGDADPAWSSDGNRIAFERSDGPAPGIYVMDADGSNVVQRTTSGRAPTWSPDGEWIAFVCVAPPQPRLCKVKAGGAAAAPIGISVYAQVSSPTWSPDGTRIAHTSDWGLFDLWFDIWVVAPDGSQPTALITHTPGRPNPYEFYQPAWSPDGGRIAYLTCPWAFFYCSSSVVSVMNADGFGMVWLATASGFAKPAWSPDGQFIAFASSNAIEWVSADGSQHGRIIEDGHSPAWRP